MLTKTKMLLAAALILPFVVPIRRNQAAPPLDGVLERRLVENRLGTRIDQERKFTGILHPRWNQPPAHQPEMAAAIFQDDNRNGLSRRDIIPRREIRLLEIAEYLPKCLGWRGNYKTSAHYLIKISLCSTSVNPVC